MKSTVKQASQDLQRLENICAVSLNGAEEITVEEALETLAGFPQQQQRVITYQEQDGNAWIYNIETNF